MKTIPNIGPWIGDFEKETVNKAMSDWYENPYYYCELFEKEFAKYHDRKYALMTPNCTSAIHLLMLGLGIQEGDEVIGPECTWIASVAPAFYQKAKVVLCDIDETTWCLDPKSVEKNITNKTKAIVSVNLFGNMANWNELLKISKKYNIPLIEDAAQSLGSTYKGIKSGKFGIGSVFSFHRTKTLTTGEGGMLLIDDDKLYKKCKMFRDHGRNDNDPMYFNSEVGYKYMPNNISASLGYAQFQRLDELVSKKHWILQQYSKRLNVIDDITLNYEPEYVYNSAWITTIVLGRSIQIKKQDFIDKLISKNIMARPFFYPLSSIPALNKRGYIEEEHKLKNPMAYDLSSRTINLPSPLNITEEQIDYICNEIKTILMK
ncbi:DegT/DnrJ/EryC1/StrS aminotransferase [Sulfurimonas gotlandica GD1]|uniref:DegT/DnrJ/EryC1/StrS aminotransferase n=1 Tax=Sulfurimonas gotlandica (strain DSM 19862 / JCM 16533 / GD1) TaxID=929558 RepID=B6BKH0_SULGG|nr:DegT/DnrJ/EryC1/StrS family aminotransferase [Sulfurimonas gotlandica]EDZ62295.1 DegT/DnrJ/EryC1/StrS aminotransferase [Sulfurimonas gotlandica GD1]EHP29025.1 DegT/DnrJ/EryC1/StrS aminotransferase [Sulfurimonas gotlandica GD1]